MTPRRIVLTGASGFVGSAVLRELLRRPEGVRIRALTRTHRALPAGVEQVHADLAEPGSLAGACADADAVVHLASRVDGDERQCERVNDQGTAALMTEAARAGAERLVQLSTTAVYGPGPHRGAAVGDLAPAPVSAASRTRLAGEEHALRAGALVLRAGLIIGAGDRWVVPALAELTRRVPAYWDGGRGRASVIAVEDLARLVAQTALGPRAPERGVQHAVHPRPVRTRELLDTLSSGGVLPAIGEELSWEESLARLRGNPGRTSERQFALLAGDHWYRGEEVWERYGCDPGPGPLARLADALPWYRSHLSQE